MQENTFGESHTFHQVDQAHQQPYKNEELFQNLPHDGSAADVVLDLVGALTASRDERDCSEGVSVSPLLESLDTFQRVTVSRHSDWSNFFTQSSDSQASE